MDCSSSRSRPQVESFHNNYDVVLHFITGLKVGGAEMALYNMLEYERKNSTSVGTVFDAVTKEPSKPRHVVVYFREGPIVEKIRSLGVPVYRVKGLLPSESFRFSVYDPISFYRLVKLVKNLRPNVIHSSLWSANIMSRFLTLFYKVPLICDLHGDCRYYGRLRNFLSKITLKILKKRIPHYFVAVSESVKASFLEIVAGDEYAQRVVVIKNGIDSDGLRRLACKDPFGCGSDRSWPQVKSFHNHSDLGFVIGTVGRLHPVKNYGLLMSAFARLVREVKDEKLPVGGIIPHLMFVGDGPERGFLEQRSQDLGISDRVIFTGEQSKTYRYYPLFDCFVLSSHTEGLSIALLEALSFGLPIVTTVGTGSFVGDKMTHDVVTNGVNGFLVPSGDEKKLCAALKKIYANKILRASMKSKNISLATNKFHIKNVVENYSSLYKKVSGLTF